MQVFVLLALLGACDDEIFGAPGHVGSGTTPVEEGWCGVQQVFVDSCTSCHGASAPLGGLDLVTDPHAALVGVMSSAYAGATLVVPGDADGSLLVQKLEGSQGANGGVMPPTGQLAAEVVGVVRRWVQDGASDVCGTTPTGTGGRYHPLDQADPAVHGPDALLQVEACVDCHGADLLGGSVGVSCDTCHVQGWRTDCVYCHGGELDATGAPPRDIDGSTAASFAPHHAHVTTALRTTLDCVACHVKPVDVLSPGHIFLGDVSPAVSEVDFSGDVSAGGAWSGSTCTVYCHGPGLAGTTGAVDAGGTPRDCGSCHAGIASSESAWDMMSEPHRDHLREGVGCHDCHATSAADDASVARPDLHLDGKPDFTGHAGLTFTGTGTSLTCQGSCHGQMHGNERWY